jgi:hypothetical protein
MAVSTVKGTEQEGRPAQEEEMVTERASELWIEKITARTKGTTARRSRRADTRGQLQEGRNMAAEEVGISFD